jgi:hypothetical protein
MPTEKTIYYTANSVVPASSGESTVVFTAKSIERILREGGTSSWRLERNHARKCDFVVCTRNAHADWVEGPEPHHTAFLVGKIQDVVPSQPDGRFLIKFSEYALVNIPNVWKGERNPVKYETNDALKELGIDIASLTWQPMPEGTAARDSQKSAGGQAVAPLTIAEAKQGLSLTFGVKPEAIEITIRG